MTKGRMEAFSDGVFAIIITIMVMQLNAPPSTDWSALQSIAPQFSSYLLSFVFLAIYWNNHHHLLHAITHVNGKVLWANINLLFWLSLIPFATQWIGKNPLAPIPVAFYGIILILSGIAYYILCLTLIASSGKDSKIAIALGKDYKGKTSIAIYAVAVLTAGFLPLVAYLLYILVALMWLVPDRRIEKVLK